MKLYKSIIFAFAAIVLMTMVGCKKDDHDTKHLQSLVEQINTTSGTTISKGMVLTKCEYKDGDSIFSYYIKVAGNRFDKVSQQQIKDTVLHDLADAKQQKLVKVLVDNNLYLQYIFDTNSKTIPVLFSPEELKAINKKQ